MVRSALITGISGQTGALLAKKLIDDGYRVIGSSRDVFNANWWRLDRLGIKESVELVSLDLTDSFDIIRTLNRFSPSEIYNLSGQSSVGLSFSQPIDSFESITLSALNLLEAIRVLELPARFFNAASTDCFGNQPGTRLNEHSAMRPVSPYAVAKTASYWTAVNYRHSFGLHAVNGILTNHESGLRGQQFVSQKIIHTLLAKKRNQGVSLLLGNTSIRRDWLWANDVVEAICLIIRAERPGDFVVGSGRSYSLDDFIARVCEHIGLSVETAYSSDSIHRRPSEIQSIDLDPSLIQRSLSWSPSLSFDQLIDQLIREADG